MPHTLKTKLIRIYETDEEMHPYMGRHLTGKRFMLKNGVWMQAHVFDPLTLPSFWHLPEPGEFVRQNVQPEEQAVGCS